METSEVSKYCDKWKEILICKSSMSVIVMILSFHAHSAQLDHLYKASGLLTLMCPHWYFSKAYFGIISNAFRYFMPSQWNGWWFRAPKPQPFDSNFHSQYFSHLSESWKNLKIIPQTWLSQFHWISNIVFMLWLCFSLNTVLGKLYNRKIPFPCSLNVWKYV